MSRDRVPSPQTMKVMHALASDPSRWRYGYELGTETGLKAGSLYPILVRLADRKLLEAEWEKSPPPGRPPRHLYRITSNGLAVVTEAGAVPSPAARPATPDPRSATRDRARQSSRGRGIARPQPDGA